ncbi:YbjN domain-containing protein [Parvularcula sp. LCG005]|uniref:YbjN domain-containing protein n=1 Tax=Parvularcula sp. LCG005 TaxID=3078805 RepID=UPI00294200A4|nr:YbjN domain-containing protein [Parvularcula sp. LCG005]WOI52133.1 hypothetical protein RUI03_08185 [Parvularcula sp. LCG005]
MKFLSSLAAAAAVVLSGAALGGAMAQPVSRPTEMLPSVSFTHIEPVLREAGFQTLIQEANGQKVMYVQANNRRLQLFQRACSSETQCAGLWMFAFMTSSASLDQINQFNMGSKPARATLINGKVALDRYLIADYGTARGSFVINAAVFVSMIDQWFEFEKQTGAVAVSFEPLFGETPSAAGMDHETYDVFKTLSENSGLTNSNNSIGLPGSIN